MIKKIYVLSLFLLSMPLCASTDCLDKYENIEFVGWHPVECYCPCTWVKGRKCVECGHLQNARPLTVVTTNLKKTKTATTTPSPQTMKETVNNLVKKYIKNN